MIEIDNKIVTFEVVQEGEQPAPSHQRAALRARPDSLNGKTYKVKGGTMKHSYYVTINDNPEGVPFEIFISSQDTEHHQWIASLTRMISAVFRRSEDATFVVEELKAIVDPAGGLGFVKLPGMKKPRLVASIPAAIGFILEHHITEERSSSTEQEIKSEGGYPDTAVVCKDCGEKAVVVKDGCATCLACGDSKCG